MRACMCSYVFTGVYFVLGSPFHIRACNEHTPANVCERVSECCVVEYCTHIAKSPIIKYHGVIAVVVVVVVVVLIVVVIVIVVGSSCFNHHSFPVSAISTQTHTQMPAFSFYCCCCSSVSSSSCSGFSLFFLVKKRAQIIYSFFGCKVPPAFAYTIQYIACIIICACTVHRTSAVSHCFLNVKLFSLLFIALRLPPFSHYRWYFSMRFSYAFSTRNRIYF